MYASVYESLAKGGSLGIFPEGELDRFGSRYPILMTFFSLSPLSLCRW
jgi:hypothetical protein